jgi:hypothetical protein
MHGANIPGIAEPTRHEGRDAWGRSASHRGRQQEMSPVGLCAATHRLHSKRDDGETSPQHHQRDTHQMHSLDSRAPPLRRRGVRRRPWCHAMQCHALKAAKVGGCPLET